MKLVFILQSNYTLLLISTRKIKSGFFAYKYQTINYMQEYYTNFNAKHNSTPNLPELSKINMPNIQKKA